MILYSSRQRVTYQTTKLKKTFKKCLTIFDEDGIIKKSSEMNDTRKRNKKFRKKSLKSV